MIIKFQSFDDEAGWVAHIPSMPGMVVQGETREDAFNQLMISLVIKLAYDNGITELPFLRPIQKTT